MNDISLVVSVPVCRVTCGTLIGAAIAGIKNVQELFEKTRKIIKDYVYEIVWKDILERSNLEIYYSLFLGT